jgi:probable rRNA maturation factor
MPQLHLSIQVQPEFATRADTHRLKRAVESALIAAAVADPVQVSLVIAGDETVRELNRRHRGVDATTDVLAFAFSEAGSAPGEQFILPPDSARDLGEVIISLPQAERQAEEQKHALERELALLVCHGALHLLGYDHESPEDEGKMRALEAAALALLDEQR